MKLCKSAVSVLVILLVALLVGLGPASSLQPLAASAAEPPPEDYNLARTLADGAQRTTLAFSGLALITGNLEAQSFFPPGKAADYTGFQFLRDNDPDKMGHNTSFLTRVANNVIYILNDSQFAQLKTLAAAQIEQINLYAYQRFPLMKAFRRLLDGDLPSGSSGLDLDAVKQASRELYLLDGQISFDRALLYANILNSLDSSQTAYLEAMRGQGFNSWPDISKEQIKGKMAGLPQGTAVAVMTYAGDLFSWYAGSVEADVYFCPERQGTYYGSFYIKDAPAIGREGYNIDEQLTATAGAALCDSSKGYVTPEQAALVSSLVEIQRDNLYASPTSNIVLMRTEIATLLRSLIASTASADEIEAQVLELSGIYGELDGENNQAYATVFTQVYQTLTDQQKTNLAALRASILSGVYSDGTPFDFTLCTTPFLYSSVITDQSLLAPYIADTDYLFNATPSPAAAFIFSPSAPISGQAVQFTDASTGNPASWSWDFGDGSNSSLQNPSHAYSSAGSYTVTLLAGNEGGSSAASRTLTVSSAGSASLVLVSPNGGETWEVGSTQTIVWTSSGVSGNVRIRINRNYPSGTWDPLFSSILNDGSETWAVTSPASPTCRIRISSVSDPSIQDASDGNFAISAPLPPLAIDSLSATPTSGVSNWNPVTNQAGANRSGAWSGTIHHPSGAQIGTLVGGTGSAYSAVWTPPAAQNFCGSGFYAVVQVTSDGETQTSTISFSVENYPAKISQMSLVNDAFQPIANPQAGQAFYLVAAIGNNSTGALSCFSPLTIGNSYIGAGAGTIQPGQQLSFFVRCQGLAAGSYAGRVYVWVSLGGYALAQPFDFSLTVVP
ncbi:MAG: PKD domain-containing protein [bacterium]